MLDEAGSVSVHWTKMPEIFVRAPRPTLRLPSVALGAGARAGAQKVALLPSTAASAYIPDSSGGAVAGWRGATLVVGVRSGRRVGIDSDEPAPTVWVPPDV